MADTKVSALTAVTTPAGTDEFPVNQAGTSKKMTLAQINDYTDQEFTVASAAQGPTFATDTYVTASRIVLPAGRIQAGTFYRLKLVVTKSAAGTVAPVFTLRTGTAGSTADTSRASLTLPGLGTAATDTGFLEILATFRAVGASAILASWIGFTHDAATTGFQVTNRPFQSSTVSGTFDSTTASMGIGLSINGGTSAAWTIQQCVTELINLVD